MPPSLLLPRSTHRLFAFKLWALEKMVSLLVALEAKPLLNVAFTLLWGQSPTDGAKVNSASVWRSSVTASTSTSETTTSS
jgi:hypothetical protein